MLLIYSLPSQKLENASQLHQISIALFYQIHSNIPIYSGRFSADWVRRRFQQDEELFTAIFSRYKFGGKFGCRCRLWGVLPLLLDYCSTTAGTKNANSRI